jgi:hypothetical protein
MSLKGRLGGAVMKRIEALPWVQAEKERSERTGPSETAAIKLAPSALDDETATAKLRERLDASPAVLQEATIAMSKRRDDYLHDRAYRLLSAAAGDAPVQPIPPERVELFAREEALGRMPIQDAFALLAESEPRLADMERRARAHSRPPDAGSQLPQDISRPLHRLIGGGAQAQDELLRTSLATSIVHQYPRLIGGEDVGTSTETPYWELPRRMVVLTSTLGPRPRKPAAGA